jgi:DNA-binding response OmpR family regulator
VKPTRVLVVEDDTDVRDLVCDLLGRAGMDTAQAADGQDGLKQFYSVRPDLVILDVSMPGMDGLHALERIREMSDVPVLVLTARSKELEKVRGLQAGADDYVTKPFGRQELVARAESLLRRARKNGAVEAAETVSDSLVTIDFARATVTIRGQALTLTPLEFKLLATFARHPNQVLGPDQLLDLVWHDSGETRGRVKLYVAYLRRKLKTVGVEPIETVRGFGYRYRPEAG